MGGWEEEESNLCIQLSKHILNMEIKCRSVTLFLASQKNSRLPDDIEYDFSCFPAGRRETL